MSKTCPKCGENLPDDAHFCGNCGYDFFKKDTASKSSSGFDGKIFLAIIVIVAIIVVGIFFAIGSGGNNSTNDNADVSEVDLTITEVNGYTSSSANPQSYSLYTQALFNKVPSDLKRYN